MFYLQENKKTRGTKLVLRLSRNYGKWAIIKDLPNLFTISEFVKEGDLFLTQNVVFDKIGSTSEIPLRKADKSYADRSGQQRQSFYILKEDATIYPEE